MEHGSPKWSVEGWDSKQVAETTQVWRGRCPAQLLSLTNCGSALADIPLSCKTGLFSGGLFNYPSLRKIR